MLSRVNTPTHTPTLICSLICHSNIMDILHGCSQKRGTRKFPQQLQYSHVLAFNIALLSHIIGIWEGLLLSLSQQFGMRKPVPGAPWGEQSPPPAS